MNVQMASVIHKSELSKMVAERLGVSQSAAGDATSAVLDSIGLALSEHDRVDANRVRHILREGEGRPSDASNCGRKRWPDD